MKEMVGPAQPEQVLESLSSDDEGQAQRMDQQPGKHGRLIPKKVLQKLHPTRRWFDSGEFYARKQGVVLQDILPGGAPVDALPAKLEPTPHNPRSPSHLHEVTTSPVQDPARQYTPQFSVCDY